MDTPKSSASPSALTVATEYVLALVDGEVAGAMTRLSPQVQWHQSGQNQFSGVHRGPEAVAALVGRMHQISGGTFRLELAAKPMVNGPLAACPVRFAGERNGDRLDMAGVDLLTVQDGLITQVYLFSADGAAEDRFWGRDSGHGTI